MKVITFSTVYPAKHPMKGEPTYFVEQIYNSIGVKIHGVPEQMKYRVNDFFIMDGNMKKHHTIRAGKRWKEGDWFSPRIWSVKPYASKQIAFAPDIQIKTIFEIKMMGNSTWINGKLFSEDRYSNQMAALIRNDGLETPDFWSWFDSHPKMKKEGFEGQILCWGDVNY